MRSCAGSFHCGASRGFFCDDLADEWLELRQGPCDLKRFAEHGLRFVEEGDVFAEEGDEGLIGFDVGA